MSMNVGYYRGTSEVEDAMAVVAKWVSGNRNIKVQFHKGTAVDADVEKGIIRIPRMACASGVTEEALMLVRGRVYHEAGHVDLSGAVSKSEYPKGAMFSIWNALEDRRMEHGVADKHVGAGPVFAWSTDYYNREIAGKVSAGEVKAALWEALCAMSFQSEGKTPLWTLTDKAQVYFDKAYDKFAEWRGCKDARGTLELAKKIYEILKEANEDFNKEQEQGQGQGNGQDGEEGEQKEKSEGKGKSKKSKKSEKSEKGEKSESKDKGKSEKSEEGDEEGEGSGVAGDMDEDSDEDSDNEDGEGSGEGDEDSDEDSDEDGEGSGKGDKESDEGSEGGSESKGDAGKAGKGEESKEGKGNGKLQPGDGEYNPQNEKAQGGKGNDEQTSLEEEIAGISQEEVVGKALEKLFGDMDERDVEYFSRRDLDVHTAVETIDEDKTEFKMERESIGVQVASMTGALDQALRSLSRCRRKPYQRQGKIDKKRLVAISQGLSKEVFFRKQDGIDLDVAVEIVIDESGSMSGACGEVKKLAIAIGESLTAIGVPFEITGSTTMYGQGDHRMPEMGDMNRVNPIIYKHYKTFNEAWTSVRQRMTKVASHMHNIDGEVVEYAAFRLAQRRERRKIVFSLSDGEPCAGHFNDTEMARNLKRVCQKARQSGIEVYGFGVGTYGPEPLYGKKNFMFLEKAESMGPEFIRDFAKKITGGMVKV